MKEKAVNDKIINIIKINNYSKFFIVNNITVCKPNYLTKYDIKNFEKCIYLNNLGITADSINQNLDNLSIMNVPYGGTELYEVFKNQKSNVLVKFNYFNKLFLNLLTNAIIKINKLGLYHNDIKSNNLLLDTKNTNSQIIIIDWALASILNNNLNNDIPNDVRNRKLQFNLPFSSILFSPHFKSSYKNLLKKFKSESKDTQVKYIIYHIFMEKFYDNGHSKYILNNLMPLVFNENLKENIKFNLLLIIEYLSEILLKFTDFKKGEFNEKLYYNSVYVKNVDIWGFLTLYLDILLVSKTNKFNKLPIIQLLSKYLYSTKFASKEIPLNL